MDILNRYLIQHKTICIPGLGSIYVEETPAQADFINKQLLPPSLHYRFDKYFDSPDKEFFSYVALQKQMADYEAIKWYNEWAYDLRNKLRNNEEIHWNGVGILKKDISGEMVFEPSPVQLNFLQPVPAKRIIHKNAQHAILVGDKETTNVAMNEFLHEEEAETVYVEKESWWIYALIIATVAMLLIFFHFYRNGFSSESLYNQQEIGIIK